MFFYKVDTTEFIKNNKIIVFVVLITFTWLQIMQFFKKILQ